MTQQIRYPEVNGHYFSFSSIELRLGSRIFTGFKSINYSDGLEPGVVSGPAAAAIGATRGKHSGEGDMEVYRLEFDNFMEALGGEGFYEKFFTVQVTYFEEAIGTIQDTLPSVRAKKAASGGQDGSDPTVVKLDLFLLQPILWNGKAGVKPFQPALQR